MDKQAFTHMGHLVVNYLSCQPFLERGSTTTPFGGAGGQIGEPGSGCPGLGVEGRSTH